MNEAVGGESLETFPTTLKIGDQVGGNIESRSGTESLYPEVLKPGSAYLSCGQLYKISKESMECNVFPRVGTSDNLRQSTEQNDLPLVQITRRVNRKGEFNVYINGRELPPGVYRLVRGENGKLNVFQGEKLVLSLEGDGNDAHFINLAITVTDTGDVYLMNMGVDQEIAIDVQPRERPPRRSDVIGDEEAAAVTNPGWQKARNEDIFLFVGGKIGRTGQVLSPVELVELVPKLAERLKYLAKIFAAADIEVGIVADGITIGNAGDKLANLTVNAFWRKIAEKIEEMARMKKNEEELIQELKEPSQWEQIIIDAIGEADQSVARVKTMRPEWRDGGATIAVAVRIGDTLITANVGDSRIYVIQDGELEQVSVDDTVANWIRLGKLPQSSASQGSKLAASINGNKRRFSDNDVEDLHIEIIKLNNNSKVLLCTDGLLDVLDDSVISEILGSSADCAEVVEKLIKRALPRSSDNITVMVFRY